VRIISKQSRAARSLLKWNINDLATRSGVPQRRLDQFEKNVLHLVKGENDAVVSAFKKVGIQFKDNFEVILSEAQDGSGGGKRPVNVKEHMRVTINPDNEIFASIPYQNAEDKEENITEKVYYRHVPTD